jgi:beta-glucosidase
VLGRETPSQRAHDLLLKMTLKEKIGMVHGYDTRSTYAGIVRAVPRLKIPTLNLQDGPQGLFQSLFFRSICYTSNLVTQIGVGDGVVGVTCFPSALTAVASWDRHWMEKFSAAQAKEELLKGIIKYYNEMFLLK